MIKMDKITRTSLKIVSIAIVVLLILTSVSIFCQSAKATNWISLVNDYTTCQNVDSNINPVNRRDAFNIQDNITCAWISFHNIPPDNHTVSWLWYNPNGEIYTQFSHIIPANPDNNNAGWGRYNVWAYINIAGYLPSTNPGTWRVETYVDDTFVLTQSFDISSYPNLAYINGIPYSSQENSTLCGPAAIQMVLGYYGIQKSQSEIASNIYNSTSETTFLGFMHSYPLQLGLNSTAFTGSIEAIKQNIQRGIPVIVLQRISDGESAGHYRVVVGYDDLSRIMITYDSAKTANYNITYNQFITLWKNGSSFDTKNWTLIIVPYNYNPTPSTPSTIAPYPSVTVSPSSSSSSPPSSTPTNQIITKTSPSPTIPEFSACTISMLILTVTLIVVYYAKKTKRDN